MITKPLDQLANELAETVQRISKITDLGELYRAQQIIFNQKEDERLYMVASKSSPYVLTKSRFLK